MLKHENCSISCQIKKRILTWFNIFHLPLISFFSVVVQIVAVVRLYQSFWNNNISWLVGVMTQSRLCQHIINVSKSPLNILLSASKWTLSWLWSSLVSFWMLLVSFLLKKIKMFELVFQSNSCQMLGPNSRYSKNPHFKPKYNRLPRSVQFQRLLEMHLRNTPSFASNWRTQLVNPLWFIASHDAQCVLVNYF